jgi:AraC family transcriptional regulator
MHPTADSRGAQSPPTATPTFIVSLIESAVSSFEVDRAASREYLFRAFALIRAQVQQPRDPAADAARGRLAAWQVKRVIAHIDANLSTALPAKDLANLVNLSVSHFCRAFKVSIGIPPSEYITRRRVDLAREMMVTTDAPLARVALDCGMNDQSSFCRVFRRMVGQSPSEWRRANAPEPQLRGTRKRWQGAHGTLLASGVRGPRQAPDSTAWNAKSGLIESIRVRVPSLPWRQA